MPQLPMPPLLSGRVLFFSCVFSGIAVAQLGFSQEHEDPRDHGNTPERVLDFHGTTIEAGHGSGHDIDRGGPNRDRQAGGRSEPNPQPNTAPPQQNRTPEPAPDFSVEAGITIPPATLQKVQAFAAKYKKNQGVQLRVTSGQRTPTEQAQELFKQLSAVADASGIMSKYPDKATAEKVLEAFNANKDDSEKAVAEMAKAMQEAWDAGHPFSNHFDGKAVDFGSKDLTEPQKIEFVREATEDPDNRVLYEVPGRQLKEAHSITDGNPQASTGQAQTEHMHVKFGGGAASELIRPDTAEFPVLLQTEKGHDVQILKFAGTGPAESDWVPFIDIESDIAESDGNLWKVTVSPEDSHDKTLEFETIGDPYYDESFKGYVLRIQNTKNPDEQIIIPSLEAVCKIAIIEKDRGTKREYQTDF